MRISLLSRLERLESRTAADISGRIKVRFGNLRRLPNDYKGEKHVVVAKQLRDRNGQEWVEFEEVPPIQTRGGKCALPANPNA